MTPQDTPPQTPQNRRTSSARPQANDQTAPHGKPSQDDGTVGEGSPQTVRVRQAVGGHNVRYVLAFGLAAVIIGFILVAVFQAQ